MAEKKNKKGKFSIKKLIYNDKYLIIISIVLAVVVWIVTSMSLSPETTKTVTVSVPVDFSGSAAEQLGLKCYGDEVIDVDVTVSCKKYLAKDITDDNFNVSLQTNVVTSSGNFDVPIRVETGENVDFTISSYYPTTYRAYFDVEDEKTMDIDVRYTNEDFIEKGYTMGEPLLSESTVTVKGPRSYVSQVKTVCADVTVEEKLKTTTSMELNAVPLDSYGSKVNYVKIEKGADNLTITIPVLKEMQLNVAAAFSGKPSKVNTDNFAVSYSVSKVNAGVLENANITEAVIGNIDFSQLKAGYNTFTFDVSSLDGFVILDDIDKIDVTVNVPKDYTSKNISVSAKNVTVINAPKGYNASISGISSGRVTIIGTADNLKEITASNIKLVADLSGIDANDVKEGVSSYKIVTTLENSDTCWIYGNYFANVNLTKA